jgi:hypothetical protein
MRTREGMKVAKANGRLRGKQPKLKPNQAKHLLELHDLGTYTQAELAELFGVGRSTIYRTLERMRLRRRNPSDPSHTLRTLRRRAEPDIIPINSPKISAASTRPTRPGLRSVDEPSTGLSRIRDSNARRPHRGLAPISHRASR